MGIYLYAVAGPDHPDPMRQQGVGGNTVYALERAGFRLWVSTQDRAPPASLDNVRAHNAVLEAASTSVTPLPMRFGHFFHSEDELESVLEERRPTLDRALERVSGAVEYGIRVVDPHRTDPPPVDRSSGKSYLEALARREEAAEAWRRKGAELAAGLRRSLGDAIREQRVRPAGSGGLVAIAHLVDRHDTGTYQDRLGAFPDRYPDLRFVFSGPWPPYGFVDDTIERA